MNTRAAFASASIGSSETEPLARAEGAEIFRMFSKAYARERREAMSLTDYLEACRDNPAMYATAAERMIAAPGGDEELELRLRDLAFLLVGPIIHFRSPNDYERMLTEAGFASVTMHKTRRDPHLFYRGMHVVVGRKN